MREVAAADGELAAQVVAGGHAWQHLNGSQWIVGKDAAQVLDVGAPEHLLGGRPGIRLPEPIGADGDGLRVARPAGKRDRRLDDFTCRDGHRPLGYRIPDHGTTEAARARRHHQFEPPVGARDDRRAVLSLRHVLHQDPTQRSTGRRVEHDPPDRAARLVLASFSRSSGQNQPKNAG